MKTNIKSTAYANVFSENSNSSGSLVSALVVIMLFTVLAGLFGFYLGDSGKLRALRSVGDPNPSITSYSSSELTKRMDPKAYDFNLYSQIVANLKDKYIDPEKVTDQALFDGSLKGMVESIGDKATTYFTEKEYREYLDSFSGKFEGIGVRLEYQDNSVIVIDVLEKSPALREGVEVGWIFSKVDGEDVSSSSIEEVVSKVRGESGSKVSVTFIDPEKKEEVVKTITREPISVDSMRLIEKNNDTVVFEVSRFTEDTVDEWKKMWDKSVNQIVEKGYKNVILDLRGNGGGFLDAAIHAANDFLEPGKRIVSEKSRVRDDVDTLSTRQNPRFKDKKVVILINGGTASASEILAGAIKFHNKSKVIGAKTYGKGTVQNTYNLPNSGAVKITTEYWLLPDGKRLDTENPITPDVELKLDQEAFKQGRDNILEEALKSLQ